MKSKRIVLATLTGAFLLSGCSSVRVRPVHAAIISSAGGVRAPASTVSYAPTFSLNAYRPVNPVFVSTYQTIANIDQTGRINYKEVAWPSTKQADVNPLLPNHSASVVTFKRNVSGGLTYLPASVSAEKGDYRVVMDYMKYRDEPIVDSDGKVLGNGRVGIGLRLVAEISTAKADLNLGSLLVIGVNAKLGYLKGSLYVNVIGMDSSDITNLIPLTSVIDETAIQAALQSLAAVKSKIHDNATLLTPHVVAVSIPEETKVDQK